MLSLPTLKAHISYLAALALVLTVPTFAAAPPKDPINTVCPISGKPVDPNITVVYEGKTFAFAAEACRVKFNEARANSLYQKLGGKGAIDAAVELFYKKVLADARGESLLRRHQHEVASNWWRENWANHAS